MNVSNLSYTYGYKFSRCGYDISYNDNIFNPYARDVLYINSGIVGIYHKLMQFHAKTPTHYFANIQRCIRVDGKHDDIHNIGKSTTHLTSFNMLGVFAINGSLEKVLTDIYNFLTSVLSKEHLYFTVHPSDERTKKLLKTIVGDAEIVELDDNYWEIDDNYGYCGYCTEVFFKSGNKDVEIWNSVIIDSFNNKGVKRPLEFSFIDTGGGLERISQCMDDNESVFDDAGFQQFFVNLGMSDASARIILDHLVTISNIINSNIFLANTGRGYVLKKFARRMISLLQFNNISINELLIAGSYLISRFDDIKFMLEREQSLMAKAEARFNKYCKDKTELNEQDVFYLYATDGISISNLKEFAHKNNITLEDSVIAKAEKQIGSKSSTKSIASLSVKLEHNLSYADTRTYTTTEFKAFDCNFEPVTTINNSKDCFFIYSPHNTVLDPADSITLQINGIELAVDRIVFNHDRVFYSVCASSTIDLKDSTLSVTIDDSARDMLFKKEYASFVGLSYVQSLVNYAYLTSVVYSGKYVQLKIYSAYDVYLSDEEVKAGFIKYAKTCEIVDTKEGVDVLEHPKAHRIYVDNYSLTSTLIQLKTNHNIDREFISKFPKILPANSISIESMAKFGYEITLRILVQS